MIVPEVTVRPRAINVRQARSCPPFSGRIIQNLFNLGMHALSRMASMPFASRQKRAGLFRRGSIDAPFFGAGHEHGGVVGLFLFCHFVLANH